MIKIIYTSIICLLIATSMAITLQAQNVLKTQTGVLISSTGGAVITLNDMDFDNDGIFNHGAGQGIFVFNGAAHNTISGSSSPLFDVLQLAKTGSGKVTLQRGIRIGSNITFDSGILDLNAQNILLGPTSSLIGESETSHITGINGGYVQIITNPLNAPSAVNPGNLGAVITSTQYLGTVTLRRGHQSQVNNAGGGNSIIRYYDIMPESNTALNATLRFSYLDAELNGLNEGSLNVWRSYNNVTWANLLFTSRDVSTNYVELAGINDFARFTLSTPGNALPLIWNSFNTQCQSGQVRISWKTEQEQNTSSFTVQRSIDGRTWTTIAALPAAGNSSSPINYSYSDQQSPAGKIYYQILQQDLDGRITLSPVLANRCGADESLVVYPNPFTTSCWISIQSVARSAITIRLYDSKGALVHQQREIIQNGNNQLPLNLSQVASGIYSLMITWTNGKTKLIKIEKH